MIENERMFCDNRQKHGSTKRYRSEGEGWLLAFGPGYFAKDKLPLGHPRNQVGYGYRSVEWDEARAQRGDAKHFCSLDCQAEYLAHWARQSRAERQ